MKIEQLKPDVIVRGPIFPERVQVIVSIPMGSSVKLVGKGLVTGQVHEPILDASQVATLEATPEKAPFDGDPQKFRLGIEALRLGLAYEYDPYFALSTVSPAQNGQGSPFGSPNPGQTIKLRLPASSSPKGNHFDPQTAPLKPVSGKHVSRPSERRSFDAKCIRDCAADEVTSKSPNGPR